MSRRWRYPRSRRGTFFRVVPPQASTPPPPAYLPVVLEPSGRSSRPRTTRRGRFWTVVPSVVAVQPPTYAPQWLKQSGHPAAVRGRRGVFYVVPPVAPVQAAVWVPPVLHARRPAARPVRRGEFWPVPSAAVVAPAPYCRPRRATYPLARRGRFYSVPPLVTPSPPAVAPWPPRLTRPSTRRLVLPRRGEFWPVPLVGLAPVQTQPVLSWIPRARVRYIAVRRGEFWPVVPRPTVTTVPWTPALLTSARPLVSLVRRGRRWSVPPTSVPAVPAGFVPRAITALRRRPQLLARRGSFIEPAWPAIPAAAYTPLSDPVSTIRVNLATATPRSNAASATVRTNQAKAAL